MWWQSASQPCFKEPRNALVEPNRKWCRNLEGVGWGVELLTSKNLQTSLLPQKFLEINIQSAESGSSSSKREKNGIFWEDQIRLLGILNVFCIFNSGMDINIRLDCQLKKCHLQVGFTQKIVGRLPSLKLRAKATWRDDIPTEKAKVFQPWIFSVKWGAVWKVTILSEIHPLFTSMITGERVVSWRVCTPEIYNIHTQNDAMFEAGNTCSKAPSFWVSGVNP